MNDSVENFIEGMENSIAQGICEELLASYSDERLARIFVGRGYIFKPIENWLDLYEKGEV